MASSLLMVRSYTTKLFAENVHLYHGFGCRSDHEEEMNGGLELHISKVL